MIKLAKARGYVTLDELNAVLPSEETSPEQIEDIMAMLNEMGINVVECEEETENLAAKVEAEAEGESTETALIKVEAAKTPADRTDDPVRMYLREMGQVELLSREGEIAIAKRIEAGREAMIAGPVRKPAHLPGHHHLARRAERSQDPAARHHRPRGHLCRPRCEEAGPGADARALCSAQGRSEEEGRGQARREPAVRPPSARPSATTSSATC